MAGCFAYGSDRVQLKRIAVFIDYQSVYQSARRSFGLEHANHTEGQVMPSESAYVFVTWCLVAS